MLSAVACLRANHMAVGWQNISLAFSRVRQCVVKHALPWSRVAELVAQFKIVSFQGAKDATSKFLRNVRGARSQITQVRIAAGRPTHVRGVPNYVTHVTGPPSQANPCPRSTHSGNPCPNWSRQANLRPTSTQSVTRAVYKLQHFFLNCS